MITHSLECSTAECVSKESIPRMTELVIGKTPQCCMRITFSITKSTVIALFLMTSHPVGSETSN